jgi:alkanesulfonate monooxygenase SsuD/methylene tetrahydromethanopterin reductase-like flavin-dependent oxidoreductase (luciferase family)
LLAPTIAGAAAAAGRPTPKIIPIVAVAVTDDVDSARARAAETLAFYDQIPSYQKVLAREGLSSAVELAVIGTADSARRPRRPGRLGVNRPSVDG